MDSRHQYQVSSWPIWLKLLVSVILSSALSTVLVMTLRWQGWLQRGELKAFDLLVLLKGNLMYLTGKDEPPDSRILIVTIDAQDTQYLNQLNPPIDQIGSISLPDDALTMLLAQLDKLNKKSLIIGSDIYHKQPFKTTLANRLKKNYKFFVICKSGSNLESSPPPNIPKESWGFSDVLVDQQDDIVRRHLLAMSLLAGPCSTGYSFNFLIAHQYLLDRNIEITANTRQEYTLNNTVILNKLTSHSGGYQGVDAKGYQILLNYRRSCYLQGRCSLENVARSIPLRHILENGIDSNTANSFKAQDPLIVLIGVNERGQNGGIVRDFFNTPYGEEIPGVFLHAQMLSQILSVVLDERPLIGWWSIHYEALWVLGWSFLGASLGVWVRNRNLLYLLLALPVAILVLLASLVIFVTWSQWAPFIPAVLATVSTLALPKAFKRLRHIPRSRWLQAAKAAIEQFLDIYISPSIKPVTTFIKNLFKNKK